MYQYTPVTPKDIHFDKIARRQPRSVLAFPFTADGMLLWVQHPQRGWEVPGGKVDPGETPLQSLHRELLEETGCLVHSPLWVAEYRISVADPSSPLFGDTYKWVYFVAVKERADHLSSEGLPTVERLHSEIVAVEKRPALPPDEVQKAEGVSPIMKDAVYESLWPQIKQGYLPEKY